MPKIDFSTIEDAQDFTPLPDGQYHCQIHEVREVFTQNGDEMWKLTLKVIKGEFVDRYIFDNLVFSEAAMKRVKLICSQLGIDVSSQVDLTPELIKDRPCYVMVTTEEYEDNEGNIKQRNVVPFSGYEAAEDKVVSFAGSKEAEADIPF